MLSMLGKYALFSSEGFISGLRVSFFPFSFSVCAEWSPPPHLDHCPSLFSSRILVSSTALLSAPCGGSTVPLFLSPNANAWLHLTVFSNLTYLNIKCCCCFQNKPFPSFSVFVKNCLNRVETSLVYLVSLPCSSSGRPLLFLPGFLFLC